MVPLSDLFEVRYGHSLELNRLKIIGRSAGGIPFVSRKMRDNGVSAYVAPISGIEPAPAGQLSCALGGNGVLSTYLQETPFYTGRDVSHLKPRVPMTKQQLLFYCLCVVSNRYRYSYGRQANRTLKSILVPTLEDIPDYVPAVDVGRYDGCDTPLNDGDVAELDVAEWKPFRYDEVFSIQKGYYNKKPPLAPEGVGVPFIGATEKRNGITGWVTADDLNRYSRDGRVIEGEALSRKLFKGRCLTVSNNGSVGQAFYQPIPFTCTHDVNPLYLKDATVDMTPGIGLFLAAIIRKEKYRWGYGRKWRPIRMPDSIIKLPVTRSGTPDWDFMETYISRLPFSSQL